MTTQVYPAALIELSEKVNMSPYETLLAVVYAYLDRQKATLWGRAYNISEEQTRIEATDFIVQTVFEILFDIGAIHEKYTIRLMAEKTLDQLNKETVVSQVDIHPDGAVPYA